MLRVAEIEGAPAAPYTFAIDDDDLLMSPGPGIYELWPKVLMATQQRNVEGWSAYQLKNNVVFDVRRVEGAKFWTQLLQRLPKS